MKVWAAGDTSKTVREIVQAKLLGEPGQLGTGRIPGDRIRKITHKSGVADAIDTAMVRHSSGKNSLLVLTSYDQRRKSFQGTEQDVIWLDEEPPLDIYTECLLRKMTTGGLVMLTFTPLQGLSEVVLAFIPEGDLSKPVKFTAFCSWDEVPHLTQAAKDELWRSIPRHQRDARSKGVPWLGSSAIYPVPEATSWFLISRSRCTGRARRDGCGVEPDGRWCGLRSIAIPTCCTYTRSIIREKRSPVSTPL